MNICLIHTFESLDVFLKVWNSSLKFLFLFIRFGFRNLDFQFQILLCQIRATSQTSQLLLLVFKFFKSIFKIRF